MAGNGLSEIDEKGFHLMTALLVLEMINYNWLHLRKIANLISKLNFYKLIPYPMDNC